MLDDNKDADSKALAVLRIADKWLENAPLPTAINVIIKGNGKYFWKYKIKLIYYFSIKNTNGFNSDLLMQTGVNNVLINDSQNGISPSSKKSPSFHSNRSENMSLDGRNSAILPNSNSIQHMPASSTSPIQHSFTVPSYEDHWTYEKIILERVIKTASNYFVFKYGYFIFILFLLGTGC